MLLIIILAHLPLLISGDHLTQLPIEREACRTENITYAVGNHFYEEPIELAFDSGINFNHIPVTRILAEECGFRERETPSLSKRDKRSPVARGIFRLSRYFISFYQKSKRFLRPELLKGIEKIVQKLNHVKNLKGKVKFAGIGKFFQEIWENLDEVLKEQKDDNVDIILEQTFRTSLQLFIHNETISDMLLNHPIVMDRIKRRIPVDNAKLLSEIQVSSVHCSPSHRDSQVVIYFKLRIPKVESTEIKRCDDIGTITENYYQYYDLPTATFDRDGQVYKVDTEQCVSDAFTFCPSDSIRETDCYKEKLQSCHLKNEPKENFVRELQQGFAVYGDFTQILTQQNDLQDLWKVSPRTLYHIIPRFNETIIIGGKEFKQESDSHHTIIVEH